MIDKYLDEITKILYDYYEIFNSCLEAIHSGKQKHIKEKRICRNHIIKIKN